MTRKKNEFKTDEIGTFFKEIIMAATGCTILFVGSLAGACLITEYFAPRYKAMAPRLISFRTVFGAQPISLAILLGDYPSLRRV